MTMQSKDLTRRTALGLAAAAGLAAKASAKSPGEPKERVLGIGGFFFRAKDPKALARWYADNLGIAITPEDYGGEPWRTEAGITVFAPFKETTKYFGEMRLQWMINFRVRDLARMATQLRASGVAVEVDPELYPNGRFGRLADPEGNPIQLWEPVGS
jgi:predicted enzyme related to lactoylglutathione lyase